MNSRLWPLGASILLTAATPAQAKYLICDVRTDNAKLYLESGAIDIGDKDPTSASKEICPAFVQYVLHDLGKTTEFLSIGVVDSPQDQLDSLDDWHRRNATNPELERTITGWRPDAPKTRSPTTSTPRPRKSAPTPGLTVKTDTSLIDARKKWDEAVLQSQRDDAAARAKQVADAARGKAEMQAKLAKLFEAMRKRGSAQ